MPPMPEKLFSGNARVICAIFASDSGRMAGPPRPPVETRPSTLTSNSSVSGSISGSDVNVFDEEIASAPPAKRGPRLEHDVGRGRRQLGPDRDARDLLDDLGDDRDQPLVLADVRAHVLAVHVRTGEVQLEGVGARVLARLGQRLPVRELRVSRPEPAMIEATRTRLRAMPS